MRQRVHTATQTHNKTNKMKSSRKILWTPLCRTFSKCIKNNSKQHEHRDQRRPQIKRGKHNAENSEMMRAKNIQCREILTLNIHQTKLKRGMSSSWMMQMEDNSKLLKVGKIGRSSPLCSQLILPKFTCKTSRRTSTVPTKISSTCHPLM